MMKKLLFKQGLWVGIAAVWIFYGLFLLSFPTEVPSDGARYLAGARFLSEGEGYAAYRLDVPEVGPQITFPPLLSLATAWVMRGSGLHEVYALRVVNFVSLLLYFLSFHFLILRLFKERSFQLAAHFWLFLSPMPWRALNTALSEPLYLGWLALSLHPALTAPFIKEKGKKIFLLFAVGVLLTLLCLTRYAGLFIVIAYAIFFMALGAPGPKKERILEIFLMGFPVAAGMGGWIWRNKAASGHLTYLDTFSTRSFRWEELLRLEADFLKGLAEDWVGFLTYRWEGAFWTYLPSIVFWASLGMVVVTFWRRRKEFFENRWNAAFPLLVLLLLAVYVAGHNAIFLRYSAGGTAGRYFQVLSPFLFLTSLVLIRGLLSKKESERGRSGKCALVLLVGFLSLSAFFQGFLWLKTAVQTAKRVSTVIPGSFSYDFERSGWVFDLLRKEIRSEDLLISNNAPFLSWVGRIPCQNSSFYPPERVWLRQKQTAGDVYLIFEKKYPLNLPSGIEWGEYIRSLNAKVIREDDWAVVAKL